MPQSPAINEFNVRRLEECYWYCAIEIDKIKDALEESSKVLENSKPWPADYDTVSDYNLALVEHEARIEKWKSSFSIEKMKELIKEMTEMVHLCAPNEQKEL